MSDENGAREPFGWGEVVLDDDAIGRRAAEMERARVAELRRRAMPLPGVPLTSPRPVAPPRWEERAPEPLAFVPRRRKPVISRWGYAGMVAAMIAAGFVTYSLIPSPDYQWTKERPEFAIPDLPPPPERDPPTVATGEVIQVEHRTVETGASGRFQPEVIRARRGDILRFTTDGVAAHNVSFPVEYNPLSSSLPPPGPYLTSPGQSYDLVVELEPGVYTFQCDPHAPMDEMGTLIVGP